MQLTREARFVKTRPQTFERKCSDLTVDAR